MNKGKVIFGSVAVVCVTALAVTTVVFTGTDGTVMATACGAIGTIVGYILGRKTSPEESKTIE